MPSYWLHLDMCGFKLYFNQEIKFRREVYYWVLNFVLHPFHSSLNILSWDGLTKIRYIIFRFRSENYSLYQMRWYSLVHMLISIPKYIWKIQLLYFVSCSSDEFLLLFKKDLSTYPFLIMSMPRIYCKVMFCLYQPGG